MEKSEMNSESVLSSDQKFVLGYNRHINYKGTTHAGFRHIDDRKPYYKKLHNKEPLNRLFRICTSQKMIMGIAVLFLAHILYYIKACV